MLNYIEQQEFEALHKLIRQTEQALNGFMSYVRRQRAGSHEYGDKRIHEDQADYDITSFEDDDESKQEEVD